MVSNIIILDRFMVQTHGIGRVTTNKHCGNLCVRQRMRVVPYT